VVFVSHDRYFIDRLANRIFEIENGRVEVFPGNYEDYLWRKEGQSGAPSDLQLSANVTRSMAGEEAAKDEAGLSAGTPNGAEPKQKRLNPIKLRQMKERCQELEEEIARLEAAITQAETALQSFVNVDETQRQTYLLHRSKTELEQRMTEWESLAAELETAEA
jgi:ATP-binding cassette subfamily F protein 3